MQVKTKNLLVGALVVLLVGALWYRVVYSPMQAKASKAKTAAHDAETQTAALRKTLNDTTTGKNKTNSASNESLLAAIPADPAEASFLRAIDALRVSSGADWQTVTPSVPTPSGAFSTINVGITVTGTEDQIARYTSGLSALPRVFILDNLSISPSGSTPVPGSHAVGAPAGAVFQGNQVQATISGRIFTQTVATGTGSSTSGTSTTPTNGAAAPTGSATTSKGTLNG